MKFKEQHKTALAKVLSDLVQSDGMVNQGEIDFLQKVYTVFNITQTSRKKASQLSLSDAVNTLKTLGKTEKIAILRLLQRLSMSDDSLDPNESMLITTLVLSIDTELTETQDIRAHFVSIPNLNFDTRNAVLYVEAEYDKAVNDGIIREYETICSLLESSQREFFYLPKVISELQSKKGTFLNAINYLEPTLTETQCQFIGDNLHRLSSAFLSKEIFLNYLNASGLNLIKPSFFFKIGKVKPSSQQDFLILEINGDPLTTLQSIYRLNDNITTLKSDVLSQKDEQFLQEVMQVPDKKQKDELSYTGFHKILIDIMLKHSVSREYSRLYITKHGDIFLTDRNNTEVKMHTLCKALYILFLFHEEGIPLNYLSDYKTELYRIYRQISTYGDETLLQKAIDNLTDFVGNTMNATLSRIKKAFKDILGDDALPYLIQGEKGGRKTIHLDRSLVVFEDRKAFLL